MMGGKLEEVDCNLCGSSDTKEVGFVELSSNQQDIPSLKRLTLVQCRKCGLVYTNPRPSARDLAELYDVGYKDLAKRNIEEEILADRSLVRCGGGYVTYDSRFCRRLLGNLNHLVKSKGRMLDVGCGEGRFIKFARDNGWQVFGQEFSSEAAKYGQDRFELDVRAGDLRELAFPTDYFDVVVMLNVIEHLQDPFGYLNEIMRIQKKGGVLYVGTPNVLLKKRCTQLGIPEHLYRFSVATLRRMLEESGFRVVKLTTRNSQDALVGFEILRHHLLSPKDSVARANRKEFTLACMRLSCRIAEAMLGIRLYKWGMAPNGGERITAFARKA